MEMIKFDAESMNPMLGLRLDTVQIIKILFIPKESTFNNKKCDINFIAITLRKVFYLSDLLLHSGEKNQS